MAEPGSNGRMSYRNTIFFCLAGTLGLASCDDGPSGTGGAGTMSSTASTTTGGSTTTGTTSTSTASGMTGSSSSGMAGNPHPLYPALDLDTLPGPGGAAVGAYEPPMVPSTTANVTVVGTGGAAKNELQAACAMPGTAVTVPDAAGHIGALDLGNVTDCDITLGAQVVVDFLYLGHLPGPQQAPIHRVRIRGGQIGSVFVDPGSTDIVLDGVVINNAVVPPAQRNSTAIYLMSDANTVNRFAVVNSIIRLVATLPDGSGNTDGNAYLGSHARNVFFANDNVVTDGNRNAWGFRIGGGENFLAIDLAVRVSYHKLIRMNDGPVDYVYVKGGTWMREETPTAMGMPSNDSFTQLGDLGTDHVYIHGPSVYLLPTETVSFGASFGPNQVGKLWEARSIAWFATSASVVSDATLMAQANGCAAGATCDYGIGTHAYQYDANLALPADPWRALPTLANDDPDAEPIAP